MKLICEDMTICGNKIFGFANNLNLLFCIDTKTGKYDLLGKIPNKNLFETRLVSKIIVYDQKLFLLPLKTGNIWMFSLITNEWKEITVQPYANNWADSYFRNAEIFENKMYIFGGYYPAIAQMDLNNYSIDYNFAPFLEKREMGTRDLFFRGSPIRIDDVLYFASGIDNSIFTYGLKDNNFSWINVGSGSNRFSGLAFCEEEIILAPRKMDMNIVVCNRTYTKMKELSLPIQTCVNSLMTGIFKEGNGFTIPIANKCGSFLIREDMSVEYSDESYICYKEEDEITLVQTGDYAIHLYIGEKEDRVFGQNFSVNEIINESIDYDLLSEGVFLKECSEILIEDMIHFV